MDQSLSKSGGNSVTDCAKIEKSDAPGMHRTQRLGSQLSLPGWAI